MTTKLDQAARQLLIDIAVGNPTDSSLTAMREALEVTEYNISDHKSENVMVSVDFMRQLEAKFSYYGELVDGEWGNCRNIEELDAAHLLPKEVYQIRKILEEAPVFGYTHAHTSDKPLHHYALVLRDLDKTVDGWCEEPEFYLNGKRVYAAPVQQAEQEPFDMDDHPPHRLCECRKCMEYFTPLPDCDAFAAFGKPIAEQTNTQLMEGFRPVSEMVAEHKQDPKKAAAIEKAKMRKAEQKPVAIDELARACNLAGIEYKDFLRIKAHLTIVAPVQQAEQEPVAEVVVRPLRGDQSQPTTDIKWLQRPTAEKLYADPVRTKDLTNDEIDMVLALVGSDAPFHAKYRAVIAADREKNK